MMRALIGSLCAALAACSGGAAAELDGAVIDAAVLDGQVGDAADGAGPDVLALTVVAPPALPVLTPCPAGWTQRPAGADGVVTCEPWPANQVACTGSLVRIPDDASCREVGAACPVGEWADGLPATGVIYVRAGAGNGGAGTMASPFGTIARGINAAAAGDIVALGKGSYDERVSARAGMTIRGACASATRIVPSGRSNSQPTLTVGVANTQLRDVTIAGDRPGISVSAGGGLELNGVLIDGTLERGLVVAGGRVTGTRVAVRRVVRELDPATALIDVSAGGEVALDGGELTGITVYGAWVAGAGSRVRLSGFSIRDNFGGPSEGKPVVVWSGGSALVERSLVERLGGGLALSRTSTLTVTDSLLRDLGGVPWFDPDYPQRVRRGGALGTATGGALTVSRVAIERGAGLSMYLRQASVAGEDVVIRDTPSLLISDGVASTFQRLSIDRATDVALYLQQTTTTLADLSITRSAGVALTVDGSELTLSRARIDDARRIGVYLTLSNLTATDFAISRVTCGAADCGVLLAYGVGSYDSSRADLRRFEISANQHCGAQVGPGGALDLHDGVVASNPIGVNIQAQPYDFARLGDQVIYRDNASNLDAQALPLPAAPTLP